MEQDSPTVGTMAEQILSIIETLLQGAGSTMKLVVAGQEEESQLEMLLDIIKMPYVVNALHNVYCVSEIVK